KVELPSFEGRNPIGWISRAEIFFEIQEVSLRERIKSPFINMEGGANHWFRFWRKKTKNPWCLKNRLLSDKKEKWKEFLVMNERPGERTTRSNLYLLNIVKTVNEINLPCVEYTHRVLYLK
ncbi:hypothetical protein V8G54_018576, partial [Vigna mungo]